MIINIPSLTKERGYIEELYDDKILSAEIIETIVDNYMDVMAWKGWDPSNIVSESKILTKTLSWSSNYNQGVK